jgi:hypothetical protein
VPPSRHPVPLTERVSAFRQEKGMAHARKTLRFNRIELFAGRGKYLLDIAKYCILQ